MSYRVINPQTNTSTVFPNESVARIYARSIKGAVVEPCEVECSTSVTACPEGTLEAQRKASRGHYLAAKAGNLYESASVREARQAERAAEQASEHFAAARVCGVNINDAIDDYNAGHLYS